MILGVTGPIGHGKSTLAEALVAASGNGQRFESSYVITEVANALRALPVKHPAPTDLNAINEWLAYLGPIVRDLMHVDVPEGAFQITREDLAANVPLYEKLFEYLSFMERWPRFTEAEITAENKYRYRALLQWIGGYCVLKIKQTIWWDELIRRGKANKDIALTILSGMRFPAEAERIREEGGSIIGIERPSLEVADPNDVTERERNSIAYDVIVHNDGTIEQLNCLAKTLLGDLQAGKPQKTYTASNFT